MARRRVCIGDLNKRITLQSRSLTEPLFAQTEFTEDFDPQNCRWARIKTTAGRTVFNGVNADVLITHEIWIRFDPAVSSETWILLEDNRRLDIEMVENVDEESDFTKLLCTERGNAALEASEA